MAYRQTEYTRKKTEASRSSLLLAAFRLFLVNGFHSTSMQQVVREAGSSIGNAYFYFKNKDDLLQAVTERVLRARHALIDAYNTRYAVGAKRLAINLYCTSLPPLSGGIVARAAIQEGSDCEMLKSLVMAGVQRNIGLLGENLPQLSDEEVTFAANAWAGTGTAILVARVQGRLEGSASELAHQYVSWQLRALGLETQSIRAGLEAIGDLQTHDDWDQFIATIPRSMNNIDSLIMPD
jgi:AcrR family transcriptional regulator